MTVSASLTQLVQEDLEEEAASLTSKVSTTVWTVLLKMLTSSSMHWLTTSSRLQ